MQWNSEVNDGFTTGTPWIQIPEFGKDITVESQIKDEDSIFSFYKKLIALRKKYRIISEGDIAFLDNLPEEVIGYRRSFEGENLVVYGNLSEQEIIVNTNLPGMSILLSNYEKEKGAPEEHLILRPYELIAYSSDIQ